MKRLVFDKQFLYRMCYRLRLKKDPPISMEKECVDFLKEVLVVYNFPVEAEDLYRKMKEMGYESAGSGWFRAANEG